MMKIHKHRGVFVVEFGIGCFILFFSMLMLFELSRYIMLNTYVDIAVAEASRDMRTYEQTDMRESYQERIARLINENYWSMPFDEDDLTVTQVGYADYRSLIDSNGIVNECNGCIFKEVTIEYAYDPIFVIGDYFGRRISRTVIVTMEHVGW
ncbi:TadE/TadG family type IV pilus assembly protein [Vibrio nomapromontoriensis]|uniref:TadE/TadG family type IV pilus assembly protein n=1 Tax=Vibrio nomapromontoriensis TaxID=2910246 RepID=UPI003D0D8260